MSGRRIDLVKDADRWGVAMTLLDFQCPHLAQADDLTVNVRRRHGRERLRAWSNAGRALWDDVAGVWIRFSRGFSWRRKRWIRVQTRGHVGKYEAAEEIAAGDIVAFSPDGKVRRATAAYGHGYAVVGTAGDTFRLESVSELS